MTILECCDSPGPGGPADILWLEQTTLLPGIEAPEILICRTADRRWLIADRLGVRILDESTEVRLDGRRWRLREPAARRAVFRFAVSQDEEHVRLEVALGGMRFDLGERAHHETLLLLARERRADESSGYDDAECGWRDLPALERMLGIDTQHINMHLFRARRQLESTLPEGARELPLADRRRGQVRAAFVTFEESASACATA